MLPKSLLRETIQEVLEEHKLEKSKGLLDDLTANVGEVAEVFDDEEAPDTDEEAPSFLGD